MFLPISVSLLLWLCSVRLLRDSDFKGEASYDKVIGLAKQGLDNDEKGYRREFIRLVETAKGMEAGENHK